jgi:cell division protein FtsQ
MSTPTRVPSRPAAPEQERTRARIWLVAGAVVLLLGIAVWVVGFTGLLGVRTLAVTGTRALSADEIRAAAALAPGEPLARVDTAAVGDRVRALPGVARVAVTRSWPSTLRITVTERTGVAAIARDGGVWLIDADGVVFQQVPTRPRTMPRLDVAAPGPDDLATRAALKAVVELPESVTRQVLAVAAPTPDSIRLTLTGHRTVVWGSPGDAATKAKVLAALLTKPGRTYDVSNPAVVTVK